MTKEVATGQEQASPLATSIAMYGEDYFERGAVLGISGYVNYSWMPEPTLRMAHFLIQQLGISTNNTVLDYGCAKGYFVKALRTFDINAFGVDISEYAIKACPKEVADYCQVIQGPPDIAHIGRNFDWVVSKDVFEHISEDVLRKLLTTLAIYSENMFLAIPLGRDDNSASFVIPAYNQDVTHITIKPLAWWVDIFEDCGWNVVDTRFKFPGMKENWTRFWEHGNGFFTLARK